MKLVSFTTPEGPGFGILRGEQIMRLDARAGAPEDLKSLLPVMGQMGAGALSDGPVIALSEVTLLPPIPNPGKVFCVASNFDEPSAAGKPAPAYPLLFTRVAEAQTGHDAPILKPAMSEKFDFEGELAVIIGKPGHKIPRNQAVDYISGYSCFNDGSVRDWQKHSTQFTPGKNFFQSGGFGPYLVTKDEVPDTSFLSLETRVNGVVMQAIDLDKMIFDPSWLISYISTFSPLTPGDVIVTGTPSGFGATRNPKVFLSDGDVVEVEVSGVGTLRNSVRQDVDTRSETFSQ